MERVEGFRAGRVEVLQQGNGSAIANPNQAPASTGAALQQQSAQTAANDQSQLRREDQQIVVSQNAPTPNTPNPQSVPATTNQTGEVPLNRRLQNQVET